MLVPRKGKGKGKERGVGEGYGKGAKNELPSKARNEVANSPSIYALGNSKAEISTCVEAPNSLDIYAYAYTQ